MSLLNHRHLFSPSRLFTPQVLSILTFGSPTGKGGFFPNGANGRINVPCPLSAVFGSTRPGTVYPQYDGTGLADPATADERLGGIPFLPRPPTVSQPPAPDTGIPPEATFDGYLSPPPGAPPPSGYSPPNGYSPPAGYSPPSPQYYSPPSPQTYSPPSQYSPPTYGGGYRKKKTGDNNR